MRRTCLLLVAFGLKTLAADLPQYTLHEWGTFTSVSGSDGVLLPGLEHEEEALPPFVKSHDGMQPQFLAGKGWRRPLHNVTIKMETPVIYFYTEQPFTARVHVGFNGGAISQWFPARSGGETPPPYQWSDPQRQPTGGEIDFAKGYQGSIDWEVQVQPPSSADGAAVFKPWETLTWVYPRLAGAALVRAKNGDAEKFLFYRGVGNFELPVRFIVPDDHSLRIENRSDAPVPALLIFNSSLDGKTAFSMLGPLKAGENRTAAIPEAGTTNWEREVYATMNHALVTAGLDAKEADAMLQTWWRSYFLRPGLRVFWIVPTPVTSRILPLSVVPAPAKQVRVLVGRSELLTPSFEKELVAEFAKTNQNRWQFDRYFSAYEARVNALKPRLAANR